MKKKLLLFLCLLALFVLSGCIKEQTIPIGKVPSERFTVSEYISDNAVFQAGSTLSISGKSESGVIIVARLLDEKNNVESLVYSNTDSDGNWSVNLSTPDPSFKEYSLKISDSTERYHEYYNNIRFGESWLIIGDNIENIDLEKEETDDIEKSVPDYNNMFYYEKKWVPADTEISEFAFELVTEINNSFKSWSKYPISIVFATDENTNIYEWLSRGLIESRNIIKTKLIENGMYRSEEQELDEFDMSNCYESHINSIIGMNFSNIVINQGNKDLEDFNKDEFYEVNKFSDLYYYMLYNFIDEIESNFKVEEKILFLQSPAGIVDNLEQLRNIQSNVCKLYNVCEIIPTYDLTLVYDLINEEYVSNKMDFELIEEFAIIGVDLKKLANRLCRVSNNIVEIPSLMNIVQVYDDKKNVVEIRLVFENVETFINDSAIDGLYFYDKENTPIEDIEYKIENNEIIINLEMTIKVPADGDESDNNMSDNVEEELEMVEKNIYLDVVKISYACSSFNYFCNLRTNGIVVVPFEIILDK